MSFERNVSMATFGAFSVPATLAGEPVQVIIDRSVSYIDDDGQVRDRITQISFDKLAVAGAKHGDLVEVDGDQYRLGRRETDDGHIVVFQVQLITPPPPAPP